ncbi:SRPBCC domain-containing protein [Microbacterium hydrocarbonoxydans]|uniref:SRPBCC domain-containing protein n=1 Tax=Microbacterium hydrocarbonoxydans TaxID=273678 RepID=UPI00203C2F13|nr:SRPBCC domain-containing protein [Microbacterium hydrocarbonoxydans]MCM3778355.1 SRPBCC domain-containing protein [Microbacterium hydrocarbonoxydans]
MVVIREGAVIDSDRFAVQRAIRTQAPIEKVWRAVTEPTHVSRWFGALELDGAGAGASGTMTFGPADVIPLRVESVNELRSITYRWSNDDALGYRPEGLDEQTSTVFTFTLEDVDGGTLLTVVESGFERTSDPAANMEYHRTGWDAELDKLVALVEAEA